MAKNNDRTGSLGFEDKLWAAADLLRNNMDPAEYKHVVLGLIFLKYISDAFEERQEAIRKSLSDPNSDKGVTVLVELQTLSVPHVAHVWYSVHYEVLG